MFTLSHPSILFKIEWDITSFTALVRMKTLAITKMVEVFMVTRCQKDCFGLTLNFSQKHMQKCCLLTEHAQ